MSKRAVNLLRKKGIPYKWDAAQSVGAGCTGLVGTVLSDSTSIVGSGAVNYDLTFDLPAGACVTDMGLVVTTAVAMSSGNVTVQFGTAAAGDQLVAATALISSNTAGAIGSGISLGGLVPEGGSALAGTASAAMFSATARTLHSRVAVSATATAGVVRAFVKYIIL